MILFKENVKVNRIIDGDTITVITDENEELTIRLLGIDTPETYRKNKSNKFYTGKKFITDLDYLYNYGKLAHRTLAKKIFKKRIDLYIDELAPKTGVYDRYLCYVYKKKWDINKYMLYSGLARVYPANFTKISEYGYAQQIAIKNKKGIWNINNI